MNSDAEARSEDLGNIIALEHVNLRVPDQQTATLFYIMGLGLTRDPYMNVGVDNMWINVGEQQFHLPTSTAAQVLPGYVALVLPDLARRWNSACRGWRPGWPARPLLGNGSGIMWR